MKSFNERQEELRKEALSYITEVLKKRGTNYEIVDPASYEGEEITEEFYDLPRSFFVDRHDQYSTYGIVMINIDEKTDKLSFVGIETTEDMNERHFKEIELDTSVLCSIADIVQNLEK
jgi:hypothetical protein